MCKQISKDEIKTLKSMVLDMSQFQLKVALFWILDGSPANYSIDLAMTYQDPVKREQA